ncbi:MAG: MBL fold metallo-hydrolase [Bacteroidota bacterium]
MQQDFKTIRLNLPFKIGSVNCYLLKIDSGYILIDTGGTNKRTELEEEIVNAGCKPGNLKLIILTHGDFDHIGNAAYLRQKFNTKIAMHHDDFGMIEHGDMFWNRKKPNMLIKIIAGVILRLRKSDRIKPDIPIDDGYDLSNYGLDAKIIHIPGHSKGSIGILTSNGDLFCGDLFENTNKPVLNSIMDDLEVAKASVEKLKNLKINTVYPGHGKQFQMELFIQNNL